MSAEKVVDSVAALAHRVHGGPHCVERARDVHVERGPPAGVVHLPKRHVGADHPRAVDQHVNRLALGDEPVNHLGLSHVQLGCLVEAGAGSDVAGLRTRAQRRGNGWVLNGSKMFITNGVLADLYFIAARTDPAAKPSRGLSIFMVEKGTPGFRAVRKLDKMGWRCSDTAELVLEDVELTADALLGQEGRGFHQIMDNFQNERLVAGAIMTGEAERAIELTLEHVKTRQAFGAPLWDKQVVRNKLADCATRLEAVRRLVHHTAWLDAQGRDCVKEVSMVKAAGAEMVQHVVWTCQQLHGGSGYMHGMEIERLYRDVRVHAIGGGATEVMLEEVAKRL